MTRFAPLRGSAKRVITEVIGHFRQSGLALDGADHDALDEVLLDERIHRDHRSGSDEDDGVLHGVNHESLTLNLFLLFDGHQLEVQRLGLTLNQDLTQTELQRPLLLVGDVDERAVPGVPGTGRSVQSLNSDDSASQRHCDLDEGLPLGM